MNARWKRRTYLKINSRFPFSTSVLSQIVSLLFREKSYLAVIEMCFYSYSLRNSCSKIPIDQANSTVSLLVHHGIAFASFYLVRFQGLIDCRKSTRMRSHISRKWFPSALRSWRSAAKRKSKQAMAGRSLRFATGGRSASITKRKGNAISISTGRPLR